MKPTKSGQFDAPFRNKRPQLQLTCFELFLVLFPIACGITLGRYVGLGYGWLYGVLCGVIGCVLGAGFGICLLWFFGLFARHWLAAIPVCQVCKEDDYKWAETTPEGTFYVCQHCSAKYLRTRDNKRFMKVLADGTLHPYMRGKPCGRWRQDASS